MNFVENVVFLGPLLDALLLLYGALAWTLYVSFTDWATVAPNYTDRHKMVSLSRAPAAL
ncbi:MAG: hypothetical protein R3A10_12135 [Caldilineaceae bacterium]